MIPFLNVQRPKKFKWVILPVPFEKTTTFLKGTKRAPEEILKASGFVELYDPITKKEAYKKVGIETDLDWNFKNIKLEDIEKRVSFWLEKKKKICLLGGEHTITLPAIKAYKKFYGDFGILHLDAHSDLRYAYEGSKLSHACVFRRIFEENIKFLQVGIRAISKEEGKFIEKNSIPVIFAHQFSQRKLEEKLKLMPEKIYISFDADFLDPSEVPSLGTPEPGGFYFYETIDIIKRVAKKKEIIGLDLVEGRPCKGLEYGIYTLSRLLYQILIFSGGINVKNKGHSHKGNN